MLYLSEEKVIDDHSGVAAFHLLKKSYLYFWMKKLENKKNNNWKKNQKFIFLKKRKRRSLHPCYLSSFRIIMMIFIVIKNIIQNFILKNYRKPPQKNDLYFALFWGDQKDLNVSMSTNFQNNVILIWEYFLKPFICGKKYCTICQVQKLDMKKCISIFYSFRAVSILPRHLYITVLIVTSFTSLTRNYLIFLILLS